MRFFIFSDSPGSKSTIPSIFPCLYSSKDETPTDLAHSCQDRLYLLTRLARPFGWIVLKTPVLKENNRLLAAKGMAPPEYP